MISIYEKYTLGFSSLPKLPNNFTSARVKNQNQRDLQNIKKKPKVMNQSLNFKRKSIYGKLNNANKSA